MRRGLTFVALLALLVSGCAGVKTKRNTVRKMPPPRDAGEVFKLQYFSAHSIQNCDGRNVQVDGKIYDAEDPANGLGFSDADNARLTRYVPPFTVLGARLVGSLAIPAGTLLGMVVGQGAVTDSQGAGSAKPSDDNRRFNAIAPLIGCGIGLVVYFILHFSIPGMVQRSAAKNAEHYNQRLWYKLELGPISSDPGVAMRLHLKF